MANYIWFNPVVKSLNSNIQLQKFIKDLSLVEVNLDKDLINYVKNEYYEIIKESNKTVIDMRCPLAAKLIKDKYNDDYNFPKIHPILIRFALELVKVYIKDKDDNLIVTTPCQSLADYGNEMGLKNTKFITWLELLKEKQYKLVNTSIDKSPIPPGFFDKSKVKVLNLKSKSEITSYFENDNAHKHELVEMLYCEDGCHNGDGIIENI